MPLVTVGSIVVRPLEVLERVPDEVTVHGSGG